MTVLTIAYKSMKNEANAVTFACGIAGEIDGKDNFAVGFPTMLSTYQKAILVALKYAIGILQPVPKDLVIKCNVKYIVDLFEKVDGKYKVDPKTYAQEVNDLRNRVPNLKIEKPDNIIVEVCHSVAEQAAVNYKLCWFGYAPCLALKT